MSKIDEGNRIDKQNEEISSFKDRVTRFGSMLYRNLPWRETNDPYAIWISEVMLQQTQVKRVIERWERWMDKYPTIDSLAASDRAEVLEEWQGLGYNRRAISLMNAARKIADSGGVIPKETDRLLALPGIGPATAAGIRAFAFNLPGVYLETNVRSVILHEFFPNAVDVPDSVIIPYVRETCPKDPNDWENGPRSWYYALLDYGAHLKKEHQNPSRRSKTYKKQSAFEGSHRQKRAAVVRVLLNMQSKVGSGVDIEEIARCLYGNGLRWGAEQNSVDTTELQAILEELAAEGFCVQRDDGWMV